MKFKLVFQVFVLLALLAASFGAGASAQAKPAFDAIVVARDMSYWYATYSGAVSATRFEKWAFAFDQEESFVVTATPTSGDLAPLVSVLDLNGNEISTRAGSVPVTQPAGQYYVLIQPEAGSGTYNLTIRRASDIGDGASASVSVTPVNLLVGESSLVSVSLNNVPAEGLTSGEFTCSYDHTLLELSAIADAGLFGADAVMVVNGPADGGFIVALAGSNGRRATQSGVVFTLNAKSLATGTALITCSARVSKGDSILTQLPSSSAALYISQLQGTLSGVATASKPVSVKVYDAANQLVADLLPDAGGAFSIQLDAGTYTVVASAESHLGAQASVDIASGDSKTLQAVALPAGDIDSNGMIDQFDAMTIGMNYNAASPSAADLNNDGVINVLDLEMLAANYRASGALAWQ